MDEFIPTSNVFGSLYTALSRKQVAELYRPFGWNIRKCHWTGFEIRCSYAEFEIESENPILMHGLVAEVTDNIAKIVAPMDLAGVTYAFECYNDRGELLFEVKSA